MPEPEPRPSTGITRLRRYHEPLRLPRRPEADPFRSPRLVARPTAAMDLTRCLKDLVHMLTPLPRLERTGSPVGCSPAPRRPSPCGRRVGSNEKLSRPFRSSRVPACAFAPWFRQGFLQRLQKDDCSPRLLQWLPSEPTIPRTGLAPAGLRDPRGLTVNDNQLTSVLLSCRTATRFQRAAWGPWRRPRRPAGFLRPRPARRRRDQRAAVRRHRRAFRRCCLGEAVPPASRGIRAQ
jgi:hypothetical protein